MSELIAEKLIDIESVQFSFNDFQSVPQAILVQGVSWSNLIFAFRLHHSLTPVKLSELTVEILKSKI